MTGHSEGTGEWLGWIQNGGWYGMDPHALTAMPECWKTSPIGGEFASCLSMKELLDTSLSATLSQIQNSHMSFLGPLSAEEAFAAGYDAVLLHLGYRLFVSQVELLSSGESSAKKATISLTLQNDGAAPFYWNWPVNLYVETEDGDTLQTIPLPISLPELLPGGKITVTVPLHPASPLPCAGIIPQKNKVLPPPEEHSVCLTLGIVDPMTGRDAVHFAMEAKERAGRTLLWPSDFPSSTFLFFTR